jgi:hypothetical protein
MEVPICPGGSRLELSALLALPDATTSVTILDRDREVFRRAVPEPAQVRLDEYLGTTLPRRLTEMPVLIDGPEPRSGAYIVSVWEAPGRPMVPLGLSDVGAGEPAVVRLDLTELPGGEGCRLWVAYYDGIRTVVINHQFSVESRPVAPVIVAPTPGAELFDDGWLSLQGRLDGDGDPGALEWLLDEELVGTGARAGVARPSAGVRTVTLRHGKALTTVEILVRPAPAQDVALPWSPPWRSRPFRSVSAPSVGPKASDD